MFLDVNLDHHQCLVFSFLTCNIASDLWFAIGEKIVKKKSKSAPKSKMFQSMVKFPLKRLKNFLNKEFGT
jgi:hypothetical protein